MKQGSVKGIIVPIALVLLLLAVFTFAADTPYEITLDLRYGSSPSYDPDNDGVETASGIIDLDVSSTTFSWNVDEAKLATIWTILSTEDGTPTVVCYGSSAACAFADLPSSAISWDETYLAYVGKDGAALSNTISAQVVYYDVDLSVPKSDIVYSEERYLLTEFTPQLRETGYNPSNYYLTVSPLVVNATGTVRFNFTIQGANISMFVCKTSDCSGCGYVSFNQTITSGCYCTDQTWDKISSIPPGDNLTCVYATSVSDNFRNPYYVKVYNSTDHGLSLGNILTPTYTSEQNFTVNHAPKAYNVTVNSSAAYAGINLTCGFNYNSSPDSDTLVGAVFEWAANGSTIAGQTSIKLPSAYVAKNSNISCRVLVTDSYGSSDIGPRNSTNITVLNSVPTTPLIAVTPPNPGHTSDLLCNITTPSLDADGDSINYTFTWYRNTSFLAFTYTNDDTLNYSVLGDGNTSFQDIFTCVVAAYDSGGNNTFNSSAQVAIGNSVPTITSVVVYPINPGISEDLTCNVSGHSDPDGENATFWFQWYKNNVLNLTIFNETNQTLRSSNLSYSQIWNCTVTPYDGSVNGTPLSARVTVANQVPLFSNRNTASANNHTEWSNITYLFATWTDDLGLDTAVLEINTTATNATNISWINISGTTDVSNFTFNTTPYFGNIWWRIIVNDTNGVHNNSMNYSLLVVNDTTAPAIDLSNITTPTANSNTTWTFTVTDAYGFNESNLWATVMNASNISTYHRINGSLVLNDTYNFSDSVYCAGTNKSLSCSLATPLIDGAYKITVSMNDSIGNLRNETLDNYTVDSRQPSITLVQIGYINTSGNPIIPSVPIIPHGHLFINWTSAVTGGSGLDRYEIAIGTAAYPAAGYSSLIDWINLSTNTTFNRSFPLVNGQAYYANVRVFSHSGASNVTSSPGVLFEDDTPPVCPGGSSASGCITDEGAWTNSLTTLLFTLNFTDNESAITQYQYGIGTIPYPQAGWDSVKTTTNTSTKDIAASGLSLAYNATYWISARAKNADNKWSDWYYSNNITVDNRAPTNGSISYTSVNLSSSNTTITLNPGFDELSGIKNATLQRASAPINTISQTCPSFSNYEDSNTSLVGSQTSIQVELSSGYCYKFRYLVTDYARNTATYYYGDGDSLSFFVDTTSPGQFTATLNSNDFYTESKNFTLQVSGAADSESGIEYFIYSVHGVSGITNTTRVGWTNTTSTFITFNIPGINHLESVTAYVIAVNGVGNRSDVMPSNTVVYKDYAAPDPVTIVTVANDSSPISGWRNTVNGTNTNVTILAGEADVSCVYSLFDIDYTTINGYADTCAPTVSTSYNTSCMINVTDGSYTYYIICADTNNNGQGANQNTEVKFLVDTSAPNISFLSHSKNQVIGGVAALLLNITDAGNGTIVSPTYNITYANNNSLIKQGSLSSPYTLTWDTHSNFTENMSATVNITITARDGINRLGTGSRVLHVNNSVPIATAHHVSYVNASNPVLNLTLTLENYLNASINITENSTGSLAYQNSTIQPSFTYYTNWSFWISTALWSEGVYVINTTAYNHIGDQVRNISYVTVDRTTPHYLLVTNTNLSTFYYNSSINITINWTDTIGIDNSHTVYISYNDSNGTWHNRTADNPTADLFNYTIPLSDLANGQTVGWTAFGIDRAGNLNNSFPNFTFTIQNRPVRTGTSNITFLHNETRQMDLGSLFSDPDNDGLTFSYWNDSTINITPINASFANFTSFNQVTSRLINISAADGHGSNVSFMVNFSAVNQTIIISNVTNTSTASSVTVHWNTDILANSSLNTDNGTATSSPLMSLTHSSTITGLRQNSTYNYSATSCNATACVTTDTFTFTTVPFAFNNDLAISTSTTGATIVWTMNGSATGNITLLNNATASYSNDTSNDSTKSIVITGLASSTSYSFNLTSCYLEETPEICVTAGPYNLTTNTPEVGGSGGSGGSGGGSSYYPTTNINIGSSFSVFEMGRNDRLSFVWGGEVHSLTITSVTASSATILVQSTPQTFIIPVGKSARVDMNNDYSDDLEIKVISITGLEATIAVRVLGPRFIETKNSFEVQEPVAVNPDGTVQYSPPERDIPDSDNSSNKQNTSLAYLVAAVLAVGLLGGLVMKEKARVDYINSKPALKVHRIMKKAYHDGHEITKIHTALQNKGWPADIVTNAALQHIIRDMRKKGHNNTTVRAILQDKGYADSMVADALVNSYISEGLDKRKSLRAIRKDLLDHGFSPRLVKERLER